MITRLGLKSKNLYTLLLLNTLIVSYMCTYLHLGFSLAFGNLEGNNTLIIIIIISAIIIIIIIIIIA